MLDRAIQTLEAVKVRPPMYGINTAGEVFAFIVGFDTMAQIAGIEWDFDLAVAVIDQHGWSGQNALGPIIQMQGAGLDDATIIDNMLAIEIDTLRGLLEKSRHYPDQEPETKNQ